MLNKLLIVRLSLCLSLLGLVAAIPAFAGSAVVGSVAGSMNATVGGQALLPNTTLFSGDNLQVKDGVAVVALGSTSRVVFGRDTQASFLRDAEQVTVLLDQGDISLFHAEDSAPVRVKVGVISVIPVSGFKTLGEVAMLNGTIVIAAKEGVLRVEGNGPVVNVTKGKTIAISPRVNAPAPQGGGNPPSGKHVSSLQLWETVDTILSGGALVFAAIDLSRSNNAENEASSAASAAAAAASAAAAATSAANSAASAAAAAANAVGCALNVLANEQGKASVYTPPPGETCP